MFSKKISNSPLFRPEQSRANFRFFLTLGILLILFQFFKVSFRQYSQIVSYFYVLIIALSGIWFELKGGFLGASLICLLFFSDLGIGIKDLLNPELMESVYLIFIIYYICGISVGMITKRENQIKQILKNLAEYDELTNCLNFRFLMQVLEQELIRAKRYNRQMTLIIIDIDFFKKINDTYGHLVGNDILKTFAQILKTSLRSADIIGRYGGEEFLIILPESSPQTAILVLDRIREKLDGIEVASPYLKQNLKLSLRFSAGVVDFPTNGNNTNSLISMADYALMKAKTGGRNRFIIEKRKSLRFEPRKGVRIELLVENGLPPLIPLKIIDISQDGLQLILKEKILKEKIACRFFLPNSKSPIDVNCALLYELALEKNYKTGLCFVDHDSELQKKILSAVKIPESIAKV